MPKQKRTIIKKTTSKPNEPRGAFSRIPPRPKPPKPPRPQNRSDNLPK